MRAALRWWEGLLWLVVYQRNNWIYSKHALGGANSVNPIFRKPELTLHWCCENNAIRWSLSRKISFRREYDLLRWSVRIDITLFLNNLIFNFSTALILISFNGDRLAELRCDLRQVRCAQSGTIFDILLAGNPIKIGLKVSSARANACCNRLIGALNYSLAMGTPSARRFKKFQCGWRV